jgi:hypothetical protein
MAGGGDKFLQPETIKGDDGSHLQWFQWAELSEVRSQS